ncbi:MAG: cytochrome c biogenesis protein ResB [Propionibacteriaceae bacterium]|nr:cytochrome c biogenesis protein ResB [Propionibacteriaceae bacterium]
MSDHSPRAGAADGLDEPLEVSPGRILHAINALLYNKAFGLVLILLTGLLSFIGVLLPQKPANIAGDPQRQAAWLEKVRESVGGWTPILDGLGFFTMFSSIPFLIVMGLLAASIVACTLHRVPILWKAARHPHTRVKARFFDAARLRTRFHSIRGVDETLQLIVADAKRHGMRVVINDQSPGRSAYLDRNAWMPFGTALAHAAFVVIMAGFVVSSLTGFREEQFTLTIGHPREVGHGTTLVAEARDFRDTYYDNGAPKDYVADLVLRDGEQVVAEQEVRINSPLGHDGVMFHQAYFGVAAVVQISDASGTVLFDGGVPLEWSTQDKAFTYGHVTLPDGMVCYVIGSASGRTGTGIAPGQVKVELYRGEQTTPVASSLLDMGAATQVGEHTLTFQREQQFTGMIVRRDPGAPIVWVGFALLVIGTCMTMFFRHQRLWLRVTETEAGTLVQMASPDRRDSGFTRFVTDLVERVSAQLTGTNERKNADD